jgi:hypothetical protein
MRSGQSLFTLTGKGEGTNRGARNLHQERVRLHRDVQVRVRLTDEDSEAEAVDAKVLARAVDAVDPRWVAPCVDERVEGKDRDLPMQVSVSRL